MIRCHMLSSVIRTWDVLARLKVVIRAGTLTSDNSINLAGNTLSVPRLR